MKAQNFSEITIYSDFRKAFDIIYGGRMLSILKSNGIPYQLIKAVSKIDRDTQAKVIPPNGESELFDILTGIIQGDTLAPYCGWFLLIVFNFPLRRAINNYCREKELGFHFERRKSRRIGPEDIRLRLAQQYRTRVYGIQSKGWGKCWKSRPGNESGQNKVHSLQPTGCYWANGSTELAGRG